MYRMIIEGNTNLNEDNKFCNNTDAWKEYYVFFHHMQEDVISKTPKIPPANATKISTTKSVFESSFEYNFSLSHSG